MSEQPETVFTRTVVKRLEAAGAKTLKLHGHLMQKAGWPDLYVGHRVFHGWLELKVHGRKVEPLQRAVMQQLLARGVPAMVLRLSEDGAESIEHPVTGDVVGLLDRDGAACLRRLAVLGRTL